MALSGCFAYPQFSTKIERHGPVHKHHAVPRLTLSLHHFDTEPFGQRVPTLTAETNYGRSFLSDSSLTIRPKLGLANSQIASGVFTLGTAAVLPFYTLMVVAPTAELTKKTMKSNIPYVVLGLLYACLLYLSWTPDTIRLMFASKYWLPELPGIAKMFSNEMTLASAWIHLLVVDLFAARQVYQDGLENEIETRHSVSMCLLFCPIGILSHLITKSLTGADKTRH